MITEAKFKYALKDMMKTMPLEDINVTALCNKIGCHRQTFYYHYQDIYDLIIENPRATDPVSNIHVLHNYLKALSGPQQ